MTPTKQHRIIADHLALEDRIDRPAINRPLLVQLHRDLRDTYRRGHEDVYGDVTTVERLIECRPSELADLVHEAVDHFMPACHGQPHGPVCGERVDTPGELCPYCQRYT